MKCCSKIEYDCNYLSNNSINEFVKWVKQFYNIGRYKLLDNDTLIIMANSYKNCYDNSNDDNGNDDDNKENVSDDFDGYEYTFYFDLDRWYVYRNESFYDYDNNTFRELYLIIR